MAATVYLDTSFLMLPAKFHFDVVTETERLLGRRVQFAVPAAVVAELRRLAKDVGTPGRDARVALELIEKRRIPRISSVKSSDADSALIKASRLENAIVATADAELRARIRSAGRPVIFLREKAKLELEGIEPAYQ